MFSLKEIFFQPLKCQPNINTLHLYRNPITGLQQIYLSGLDGLGVIVEYIQATNEFKAHTICLQDSLCKSFIYNRFVLIALRLADCRVLSMEILPISKYNNYPSIVYGYAKTTGSAVSRFVFLRYDCKSLTCSFEN